MIFAVVTLIISIFIPSLIQPRRIHVSPIPQVEITDTEIELLRKHDK